MSRIAAEPLQTAQAEIEPSDVLLYVQHLLGIGHLRRAALVARALSDAGISVTLATGGMPVPALDAGSARIVQLPALRSRDEAFSASVDAQGREIDEAWKIRRREELLALYRAVRPRVLMTEQYPFGRRQMRFELIPLLEAAMRDRAEGDGPAIVCSLRDILTTHKQPA